MLTATVIRQKFLDFFKSKGHSIVPSAPIVVKNDPTLLFTNAGMNQFKDIFLGNKKADSSRVADTQKCLRVSGKHNDLEEVGVDTYHHTMFEMLGNWSFGDYFKEEAIAWSWELLTKVYQIPEERLYVTVFEGDEKDKLEKDNEAYQCWKKWIAEDRILKGNKKDNFWEMGDTGPCGPCSEIHVDCRSDEERQLIDGKTLVNNDHPQVIEIWNIVFMQYNRMKDGSLQPLPAKHVDTGMGLERLVRVLQGKQSNYDTDLFIGTIQETEKITQQKYTAGDSNQDVAFRVIADHIRAIAFSIVDGQLPSNTGAGYVIRRILRRAVRYYYSFLDYQKPLLTQLIPTLAAQFEQVFPELTQQSSLVAKVIREEEEAFLRTLDKGLKRLDEIMQTPTDTKIIDGKVAFELNDTYGFPIDLTTLIARENGWGIDQDGFEKELQQQKERSRAATQLDMGDWTVLEEAPVKFVGYDTLKVNTKLLKYRTIKTKNKQLYQLVLQETPFYAESGGQVGDTGVLIFGEEQIPVIDTKKENDLIVHFTEKLPAQIQQEVTATVNAVKRTDTQANHSATHLLHAALREVLGTHIAQKGSLVCADYLRFDFSHFAKMTDEEIKRVQERINEKIRENAPVQIKEMPIKEALVLGAMALFGEKYGEKVRVVTIDPNFSIELCGGTHVASAGMIGLCVITSESAVAAGVRRIEALTGKAALQYVQQIVEEHKGLSLMLKTKDPVKAVEKLMIEKNSLEKQLEAAHQKQIQNQAQQLIQQANQKEGIHYIAAHVDVPNADALKKLYQEIKQQLPKHFVILTANIEGKASVVIGADDERVAQGIDAGKLIKEKVAPLIKGGGGGQKNLATAGGQDTSRLAEVLQLINQIAE
jgi:alanyl-tRNA synthetase